MHQIVLAFFSESSTRSLRPHIGLRFRPLARLLRMEVTATGSAAAQVQTAVSELDVFESTPVLPIPIAFLLAFSGVAMAAVAYRRSNQKKGGYETPPERVALAGVPPPRV